MKRILMLLGVLCIAAVAYFVLNKNLNSTNAIANDAFKITNVKSIDKIFITSNNKEFEPFTISRSGANQWKVQSESESYEADENKIGILLDFMSKLEVKAPVPDKAKDQLVRELALTGTKAIFYRGSKEIKTIYVGRPTADEAGTVMFLPGTKTPCEVVVPGWNGTLSVYFYPNLSQWRSLNMISVNPQKIKQLTVSWPSNPEFDFSIKQDAENIQLQNSAGKEIPVLKNSLRSYLEMFKSVTHADGEMAGINKNAKKVDSILMQKPLVIFSVITDLGKPIVLRLFQMPVSDETYSLENRVGELRKYEQGLYWGNLEGSKELWEMQDITMKNKMRRLSDFPH